MVSIATRIFIGSGSDYVPGDGRATWEVRGKKENDKIKINNRKIEK